MSFDWKPMAMVLFGMCMGIFTGMQMNVDAQAHGQAQEMCKVCEANLGTMVDNFNALAYQCKMPKQDVEEYITTKDIFNITYKVVN